MGKKVFLSTNNIKTQNNVPLSNIDKVVNKDGLSLTAKTDNVTVSSAGEISVKDISTLKLADGLSHTLSSSTDNPYLLLRNGLTDVDKIQLVGSGDITVSGKGSQVVISGTGSGGSGSSQLDTVLSIPVETDLNEIQANYVYITGTPTVAQKASCHYPQNWIPTANPRIITIGGDSTSGTQILHDKSSMNSFFLRSRSGTTWTDWKKFDSGAYVNGTLGTNLNSYLWPGHYIIKATSTQAIENSPVVNSGAGYPGYLDVYQLDSNLILQTWRFRTTTAVSQENMNNFGTVLSQRYIYITTGTDVNGNETRTATTPGEWYYIGAPLVYNSAPVNNNCKGRLWYDTSTNTLKVFDGTNWQPAILPAVEAIRKILAMPVTTDLNTVTEPYTYIQGTPTAAQKASCHYPQDWDITGYPKIITFGGQDDPRTQILHDRNDSSVFFLRTKNTDGWTEWKKFLSTKSYVSGSSTDLDKYLFPGHYIVKNRSTVRIGNAPTVSNSGYGHGAYLDVYEINSALLMQRWYYRSEDDVTNADLDDFGSVECQRFIGFSTGTDANGNEERSITAKGKWNFIGAPFVDTEAPKYNNCSGRLWYNPDNGLLKIFDGSGSGAWKSISPVTVFNSTTTPDAVSEMHNFWVNPTSQQLRYYEANSKEWISLGEQDQAKTLVALPSNKTDLNNINVEYAYIQGDKVTEAQKASFHYPQDWDIESNPRVITLGYDDTNRTQILHDRTNVNHFFMRFSTYGSWTAWQKFTTDTRYVSGRHGADFNEYLWPGHYIVKDSGSQDFQNGPDEAYGGAGYPCYLDVYQVDSNLICQHWRFRKAEAATQLNISHFAGVLCQRYVYFSESTESDGSTKRTVTMQGDWAFIGGVWVYPSAPPYGKARGRLWYNPNTSVMKIHDGVDWQDIGSPIMVSTGASTPSVVSGRQQFWIDPAGTLAYYDASKAKWVNFVNP